MIVIDACQILGTKYEHGKAWRASSDKRRVEEGHASARPGQAVAPDSRMLRLRPSGENLARGVVGKRLPANGDAAIHHRPAFAVRKMRINEGRLLAGSV
jgi:hypothetical protein